MRRDTIQIPSGESVTLPRRRRQPGRVVPALYVPNHQAASQGPADPPYRPHRMASRGRTGCTADRSAAPGPAARAQLLPPIMSEYCTALGKPNSGNAAGFASGDGPYRAASGTVPAEARLAPQGHRRDVRVRVVPFCLGVTRELTSCGAGYLDVF